MLIYGGHLIVNGHLTAGELVTFLLYMGQVWSKSVGIPCRNQL